MYYEDFFFLETYQYIQKKSWYKKLNHKRHLKSYSQSRTTMYNYKKRGLVWLLWG